MTFDTSHWRKRPLVPLITLIHWRKRPLVPLITLIHWRKRPLVPALDTSGRLRQCEDA